jgi:flavin-dependent dehydrogenase
MAMGGVVDRYRRMVVEGRPVATGIAMVGDAWACTNPSLGRGMALGLAQAQLLRDTARAHLDDPAAFAEAWDAVTESELTPWYRDTVEEDRERLRDVEAQRNGRAPEPPDALRAALMAALAVDADLFRAFMASRACLTPLRETLARPDVVARLSEFPSSERRRFPGPDRGQLLQLVA